MADYSALSVLGHGAHGKANKVCFNFFEDKGAYSRDELQPEPIV
jgi:hypothetical protein